MAIRLFTLLVLLTLLPAAFVLWFMNEAVTADTASAQQRELEAYRGQLRLVRARLDPLWRAHAARLEGPGTPEQQFQRVTAGGIAEGAVLLDDNGGLLYPDHESGAPDPVIDEAQGVEALAARLNDYSRHLPARVRLRLMDRLRLRAPNVSLPTQAALRLSIELTDAERTAPMAEVIRETSIPGIWALSSEDGRVIALYRTGRLEATMHDFLHQVETAGVRFVASPPGEPADAEAIAAGTWLPGWQLSFVPLDATSRNASDARRRATYVSVALAGVVVMTLIGVAVGQSMRRHLQVARLKTDLVAAASHELRTPLASMRVLVDGLLADPEPDPRKTREYLQLVAVENARLSRLIENFLTFSRLDGGRQPLVFAAVAPAAIVETAVGAVGPRLPEGCNLRVDVAPALPAVRADAEALGAALVNLLDNALKYTSADKRIAVRAGRDGDGFVQFDVVDNGIGIPVSEQRRIFRRFYRVDPRLSGDTTGVGLGLSIVEGIVRAHGGTVGVRSEPGAGSTFTLRVPCAPGVPAPSESAA